MNNFYQNETTLEACPFCGRHDTVGFLTTNYPGERRVVCNAQEGGCGGSVGAGDSDDEAARKWNRRTASPQQVSDYLQMVESVKTSVGHNAI